MNTDNDTIYIIDSYGLIFRCYFAFISRPLTNQKGENISALFGFFRNLHYILEHYNPKYLIAAMDSKTKTFRHQMYEEYKATRNKTPEDLHEQIPWICEILQSLGVPVLQCDGYEADDIIATVAKKCSQAGRSCRILSGDKDLMQLVDKSTQILKPENGGGWKLTGADGVRAEWGVEPEQLLDLLSLYGDSADNIPGVKGIGVKTASALLNSYKSLDGIYSHIDDIKGAAQKKLIEGRESAYFSQKLVRLCSEVPCQDIDKATAAPSEFNFASAAQKLMEYGAPAVAKQYASIAAERGQQVQVQAETARLSEQGTDSKRHDNGADTEEKPVLPLKKNQGSYRAVTSLDELTALVDRVIADRAELAFDCETDGLDTMTARLVGFSLCKEAGQAVYIPLLTSNIFEAADFIEKNKAIAQLKRLFEAEGVTLVFHNGKFDYKILRMNGLALDNGIKCTLADTMLAAWLLQPERNGKNAFGLEHLGETRLGLKGIEYTDIVGKGQTFADIELEKAVPYAAEDADFTFQLWQLLKKELGDEGLEELYSHTEMPLMPVLAEMEILGIHLDGQSLNEYSRELEQGIETVKKQIYAEVGHEFNIASPMQLQTVLFEERGLKAGKKTKRGYSTDTSVLEELALYDSVPRMILQYREMTKLQSTYVETLPKLADKHGRIHTDFVQTGTATGRLSCREPNLQNIPVRTEEGRKIRSAFTAPEGKVLISADYSQIELVVLAHLSKDKNMQQAFQSGTDVHKSTAALIFGVPQEAVTPEMRRTAKTINFGVIYGMSAFRLANDLGISRSQAKSFIDNYFAQYSSVSSFIQQTILKAEQTGYVQTILGRKRPIMNINSRNKVEKSAAERIAVNTPVQGSAADIVKKAMLAVSRALNETDSPARLLLQVHDELILECPDNQSEIEKTVALIKDKMENTITLDIPLRVSIEWGKAWGEFH